MQERMQEKMQEKIRQNVSNIGNMEITTNMTNTMNMTNVTSLEDVKALAASGEYRRVPVCRELFSDLCTPLEALRALQMLSSHCFLLESAEESRQWGRYTFLGYDPSMELTYSAGVLTIRAGSRIHVETDHPGEMIEQVIRDNRAPIVEGLPPFTGGLVGYFAYDYFQCAEPALRFQAENPHEFRDVDMMLFDKIIAFDNYRQRMLLIVNIRTENLETAYNMGLQTIAQMEAAILRGARKPLVPGRLTSGVQPLFSRDQFCEKVRQVKQHIYEGDIFQLVLSNPMEASFEGSLLNAYRVLRTTNPSPYMFYFSGDVEIAGASPETLIKITGREVRTFPLAGTRPRGKDYAEDLALEKELLGDEKERAEHNMLVDLGRNDLGRICDFGTVEVEKYMAVERYSHVMHIGSEVKGTLRDGVSAIDAVDAVLPAGTLSGAPKIRACQIIDRLENNRRGIYGGAIGYIDFTGNLDLCIAIRLAFAKDGKVFVRSGAGIVADSVPENEYQECINKARAVVQALETAGTM